MILYLQVAIMLALLALIGFLIVGIVDVSWRLTMRRQSPPLLMATALIGALWLVFRLMIVILPQYAGVCYITRC